MTHYKFYGQKLRHDYNYNIHGLVQVRSNVELPLPESFRNGNIQNPDIELLEEDLDFKRPEKCNITRVVSYYWLNKDGLLRFEFPGRAKLELDLRDVEEMKIRFNSRFIKLSSKPTLEFLVMRLLQLKLVDKGYAMIHTGCVAFNDKGSLIIAPSNIGKTSTVLPLVASGAAFLGDDHVLVNEDSDVLCYPRELTISPHTITSGVVKGVSFWKRILAKFRPLYAMVLRIFGNQNENRKVPKKIIKERATIDHVFALKGFAPNPQLRLVVEEEGKENMVETMILPMLYMEGFPDSYVDLYFYLRNIGLYALLERSMEILRNALRGVECYEVKGPNIESWPRAIRERLG